MSCTPVVIAALGLLPLLPQDRTALPAPTKVVRFTPPAAASGFGQPGTCTRSLVSDRTDAYRCVVAETTHDPCFATYHGGLVLCNADPRDASSGVLVATNTLTPSSSGPRGLSLRAWFFELEDGSTCRPLIFADGREVDGMIELYTCRFAPPGADAVLGEIDTHAAVWTIQQASLNKRAPPLSIKQLASAAVKTAWQ